MALKNRKSRWRIVVANVAHNLLAKARYQLGWLDSDIGATHSVLTTDQSTNYINRVFHEYLTFGGLVPTDLVGKRVLEIGPGDNLGVALRFYAAGAAQVVCIDKFCAKRSERRERAIYQALRCFLSPEELYRFDELVDPSGSVTRDGPALQYICGLPAEDADRRLSAQSFDMVVSRAVLWEIFDTEKALRAMDRVLRPGGLMIHKVAFLDWMFRQDGYHPLEFLTIPDPIYRLMSSDSGKCNRHTIDYYRGVLSRLRYDVACHVTRIVGEGGDGFLPGVTELVRGIHYGSDSADLVASIRPRLARRFRELSDEDLLVEDMFLVAVKPRSARQPRVGLRPGGCSSGEIG